MRLRLLLEAHQPITIPWNYRTDLTKAVYMTLNTADPDYATRLRDHGFSWKNRIYRLFVYSDLTPVHWSLSSHGLADVRWMTWQIGSPDQQFMDAFIKGIERQAGKLHIFGTLIEVVDIVRIDPPELGDGLVFRTVSPIAVSVGDPSRSRHPIYLRPDQLEFVEALRRNLITKWQAFHQREWDGGEFDLRVWNPKQKLVRVFDANVRAWHLHLQMWGDEGLIRFAHDTGLGIKNSQGFGMIEPGG